MDFGLIAMILVVAKIALDYVAPRTKNKVDDKAKKIVDKANELAPLVKPLFPKADSKPVEGFATNSSRDHRSE